MLIVKAGYKHDRGILYQQSCISIIFFVHPKISVAPMTAAILSKFLTGATDHNLHKFHDNFLFWYNI